jgi:hypothetical protein
MTADMGLDLKEIGARLYRARHAAGMPDAGQSPGALALARKPMAHGRAAPSCCRSMPPRPYAIGSPVWHSTNCTWARPAGSPSTGRR